MLKLKLQYFGHLMGRTDSLEKTLMLGKIEGRRRREWQGMRWLDGIMDSIQTRVWASSRSWWWTGKPGVLQSVGLQRVGHEWATKLNWYLLIRHLSLSLFLLCTWFLSVSLKSNERKILLMILCCQETRFKVKWIHSLLLSHFSHVWLCATPETAAHPAPPFPGLSRQEHWSGLPFPSPKSH